MEFFTDTTEVFFNCFDKAFNVSSIFCTLNLPFSDSPITIRWYGVIIAFGFTLAVLFGGRTAYKWKIDINKMIDILIYGMIGGIIGARAYYVFSEWDYYGQNPGEIIKIWHGGLAIYGGLIGGLIAAYVVCKVEKINVRNLLDLCSMSFLIGQGIGRWGNFANQEAFGVNTSLPWGMYSEKTHAYLTQLVASGSDLIVDPSAPVHPTFLYESIWCLLSFAFIYFYYKKFRKFSGQLFLLYGILYGAERFFVEGLRTDSLYFMHTSLRVSQLVSLALLVVCGILFVILTIKYTKDPKPIEGIDFYTEIPLYNKKKKAFEAKKLWNKLQKKAEAVESVLSEDESNEIIKLRLEKVKAKAEQAKAAYEKAQAESDAADAKREAKKAAKAAKKA